MEKAGMLGRHLLGDAVAEGDDIVPGGGFDLGDPLGVDPHTAESGCGPGGDLLFILEGCKNGELHLEELFPLCALFPDAGNGWNLVSIDHETSTPPYQKRGLFETASVRKPT
jgi:hypothetical protein